MEEAVDCGLSSVDAAEPTATAPSNDDSSATAPAATSAAPPASGDNLQAFTGQLGGAAPSVSAGGRGFIVEDNDEFVGSGAALSRSCDVQHNGEHFLHGPKITV